MWINFVWRDDVGSWILSAPPCTCHYWYKFTTCWGNVPIPRAEHSVRQSKQAALYSKLKVFVNLMGTLIAKWACFNYDLFSISRSSRRKYFSRRVIIVLQRLWNAYALAQQNLFLRVKVSKHSIGFLLTILLITFSNPSLLPCNLSSHYFLGLTLYLWNSRLTFVATDF